MTIKTDEDGRMARSELFPPNSVFDAQRQPDGSVRVEQIAGKDAPVVEPVVTAKGFLMLPVKLDRKIIAAAIRADRDAQ
jgi:hypothetical protein